MARILLGVSGGIAAYKAVELTRLAMAAGHSVRVVMTPSSRRFIGAATFEGITGAPVLTSEFEEDPMRGAFPGDPEPSHDPIGHLEIAANADLMVIAPASANTIAKLASGIADSMLTTSFLALGCPVLLAPAMNEKMWHAPSTSRNVETLRQMGVHVMDPDAGSLASRGEAGKGRLPEPAEILSVSESLLRGSVALPLDGRRVLVSAGGTREPVDGVRFIGNRSSGRMGRELASAAVRLGAEVVLVEANPTGPVGAGIERVAVETTAEMQVALAERFQETDLLLMAAAPADFRPAELPEGKLHRDGTGLVLELVPTEDIVAGLSQGSRDDQLIVAFAAEWGPDGLSRAREKLDRKGVDLVVLNDVSDPAIGFDSPENRVCIVGRDAEVELETATKRQIAEGILDQAVRLAGWTGDEVR